MDLHLKGKKAIVVGGARGIGFATAELLAKEGADVAICARSEESVEDALAKLKAHGGKAIGAAVNVKKAEAYKAWLASAAEGLGGCDILVCMQSAGGGMDSEKNWSNNFEVDLMGSVRAVDTLLPQLSAAKGAILLVATTAAVETFAAPQAYNALKTALITWGKQLSQSLGSQGVRVNVVSPGPVYFEGGNWEMIEGAMEKFYKATLRAQPTGRLGSPEEIARTVVFLASGAASWITGVNLVVDGGFTKRVAF
jgi:3-oxoacyl-[acyl-carrier protein] reductase